MGKMLYQCHLPSGQKACSTSREEFSFFPRVNQSRKVMKISGRHILTGATLFVNGRRVEGQIRDLGKELVEVSLEKIPPQGMNMLQVHNPKSYLSNELIFYSETHEEAIRRYRKEPAVLLTTILNSAIVNHNPEEARILLEAGADINMPHTQGSLTAIPNHYCISVRTRMDNR